MPLPSVSMAALRSRDAAALEALRASLSSVGFLHLSDHGIASEVLGALSVARAFFESDEDTKSKAAHPLKGFIPVDGCVNAVRPPHLHEKFSCGRLADSLVAGDPYYSGPSPPALSWPGRPMSRPPLPPQDRATRPPSTLETPTSGRTRWLPPARGRSLHLSRSLLSERMPPSCCLTTLKSPSARTRLP